MYYLSDYHTHSTNSIDGHNSVMELCQSALNKGLSEIAITDHFEPFQGNESCECYKPNVYFTQILKARDRFKGRLLVKMGVELGQPHQFPEISQLLIDSFPYDYVLGSAHKLPQGINIDELDYNKFTLDKLCKIYLEQLNDLADWGEFDCIGHLDLIKRYSTNHYKTRITLADNYEMLVEVFKKVISKGKGIEINTSGLRQSPKETMPGIDVLKIYRELGGEVLTIGSDAHYAKDVGSNIIDAVDLAAEAGFKYITVFNNRLPQWKRIDSRGESYNFSKQLNIS